MIDVGVGEAKSSPAIVEPAASTVSVVAVSLTTSVIGGSIVTVGAPV